ncbi:extracellular solute-binding protein [Paenibacillus athensensis]|uniref:ABC transporter substrate-binding protein n=1 Tax=Paenibacillus athensensis TaxID=1967502 RepID=UPI001430C402|nr:extracellular solute-binding protein [Paenibacillus athensensis]MCD1261391.1 extracellular solute-binding protein [Paenibacillus athensensis]
MKKKKFSFSLTIVLVLIASLIAACSNGSKGATNTAAPTTGATTATPSSNNPKDVTLRFSWWGAQDRNKATLEAIDLYMKKNPGVKIQGEYMDYNGFYEKLVAQLSGGTAPDIIQIVDRWFLDLAGQKPFLLDLDTQKSIDFSTVDPEFMKTQLFNGKKVGFPTGLQGGVLLYNKAFFKKFGIPEDTVWTWDNLIEWGKKVQAQDKNSYLFSTDSDELDTLLRTYQKQLTGNQWIKDDYSFGWTKDDMVKMLTFTKSLFDQGVTEPLAKAILYKNKSNENPAWIKGTLGMQYKFISLIPNYLKIKEHELGVAALPVGNGMKDTGVYTGSTLLLSINAASKNAEEAAKFINWMSNDPEAIGILGTTRGVPATQKARDLLLKDNKIDPLVNQALETALKTSSKVLPDNAVSQNQELYKIWTDTLDQVGYGKMTPEQATDELIKQFDAKLKTLKK